MLQLEQREKLATDAYLFITNLKGDGESERQTKTLDRVKSSDGLVGQWMVIILFTKQICGIGPHLPNNIRIDN